MRGRNCRASCATCAPSSARTSNSRCTAPIPSSTARCSNWSRIRSPIWCATAPITASKAPAERLAAGKPAKGTIRLSACHEGGHIIIEIADDGRGLDIDAHQGQGASRTVSPAKPSSPPSPKRKSAISSSRRASRTAAQVTSISGRGVGMDVVRTNIEQIGGTVDLKSACRRRHHLHHQDSADAGDRLGADRRGRRRALRHSAAFGARTGARRQRRRAPHRAHQGHAGAAAAQQAVAADPPEGSCSRLGDSDSENGFVVVTQVGSQIFGIVVDGVFHTEEIVIKPMSSKLRHIAVFSGTTILGDGSVIMIIDPNGVAQALGRAAQCGARDNSGTAEPRGGRATTTPSRCWCSAPARSSRRRCRCRWSRGSRRSIAARSKSPTAAIWCNTAISSCRCCGSTRESSLKQEGAQPILVFSDQRPLHGPRRRRDHRHRRGAARHRSGERSAGRARLCRDQGQRHRDHRRRPFPAAGVRRLVPPPRCCGGAAGAHGAAGRRFRVLPRHAGAADQGGRLPGGRGRRRPPRRSRRSNPTSVSISSSPISRCRTWTASSSPRRCAPCRAPRRCPIIALSAMVSAEAIERGRAVGFHDFVAKFDRAGLIAAIKEQSADLEPGGMTGHERHCRAQRLRHLHDGRPAVRPADRARAGRVQAGAHHPRAARRRARLPACSICAAASSPRSICAAGSVLAARDGGQAADGDRHRIARRIVRPSGRCGRRGAQAARRRARAKSGQSRPQSRAACRPACIGSTVSSWSCSTSTGCSISARSGGGVRAAMTTNGL